MEKFICIHGHFYQPPRENSWLEFVEIQDSAAPCHDWNERVTLECYAPNATARILDGEGRIEGIVNNYSKISFNFGPTVLSWMKAQMPDVHDAIIAADKLSQENFSGHGSAIAQVYNHMIMPLANRCDKYTQVRWGITDFEHRFGRKPEGMWLSETAADSETLDVLAEMGILFTILSPYQASRIREIGKRNWRDVIGGTIDPTRPYLAHLPSGRTMTIFFYDGPVSHAVAFEQLLESGQKFAERVMSAFSENRKHDQLVHIATDGESYGHHHRHGEMALAYSIRFIERNHLARMTNYGEFLEHHPATHHVRIHERSAWSCPHGLGRWMENCGCNSGGGAGWNQNWRGPLRAALDWLRDELVPLFEGKASGLLRNPWQARDDYISVLLDRSPENLAAFFIKHARRELGDSEKVIVLKLLELQRHAMLMYTSCGWFFDEVSGIETVQVIQYAARSIQLAAELFDRDLEPEFLKRLQQAKSNIPEHQDGRAIYNKFIKPAMVSWEKAMGHYAISSVFRSYSERTQLFHFTFENEDRRSLTAGKTKLAVGRTRATSGITQESICLCYAVLYLGEHNLTAGVCAFDDQEQYLQMQIELESVFQQADFPQVIRLIDRHCGQSAHSLKTLFKDEQRKIIGEILGYVRDDLEVRFRLISERYTPLMHFLNDIGAPFPAPLQVADDYILYSDIMRQIQSEEVNVEQLRDLLQKADHRRPGIYDADLSYSIKNQMEALIQRLAENPGQLPLLSILDGVASLFVPRPLGLNLWKVQNIYAGMLGSALPKMREMAKHGDEDARSWLSHFFSLGDHLGFARKYLQL